MLISYDMRSNVRAQEVVLRYRNVNEVYIEWDRGDVRKGGVHPELKCKRESVHLLLLVKSWNGEYSNHY